MPRLSNLPPGVTDLMIEEQAGALEPDPADSELAILKTLSTEYVEVYNEIEALEAKVSDLKKSKDLLIQTFVDKCTEAGLDKISTDRGSFAPVIEKNIGVKKEHQEEIFSLLENQGLGASITRSVHFQTLNKHYRNGELDLDDDTKDYFKTWDRKKIRMRRRK